VCEERGEILKGVCVCVRERREIVLVCVREMHLVFV
jgi:hypothetical protein